MNLRGGKRRKSFEVALQWQRNSIPKTEKGIVQRK